MSSFQHEKCEITRRNARESERYGSQKACEEGAEREKDTFASSFTLDADPRAGSTKTSYSSNAATVGADSIDASKPFVHPNGRTYLPDRTLPYPLPVDLPEVNRQSLRTLLLMEVEGGPVANPALKANPPKRVLEMGCGSGFWSMMCHQYFQNRGYGDIEFVGLDIGPLAGTAFDSVKPDSGMKWTFVQHDVRRTPWPFDDGEFDLVFSKDMTLVISTSDHPHYMDENLRVLKSGGTIEIWETDHTIRTLRPQARSARAEQKDEAAFSLGIYPLNINTPLSAPLNTFLVSYNKWLTAGLQARGLMANPCTGIHHYLLQESELLTPVKSHRVAIPLSEMRWEREDVGKVVTRQGKPFVETGATGGGHPQQMEGEKTTKQREKTLTTGQAALRSTALKTVVEEIQALEPLLREVSGQTQNEWDSWSAKMMTDLVIKDGAGWGECLEVGKWWAVKR